MGLENVSKTFLSGQYKTAGSFKETDKLMQLCNCLSAQKMLLDATINHDLNIKYPIKLSLQKTFLKTILNMLESSGSEVLEEIYQAYIRMFSEIRKDEQLYYYTHTFLEDEAGCVVTIKQSCSIISEGTTGLAVWQGGSALAEYLMNNRNILSGKRVLELGCGLGVTGITSVLCCDVQEYIFSDNHPTVLRTLCHNISASCKIEEAEGYFNKCEEENIMWRTNFKNIPISVMQLDWTKDEHCSLISALDIDILFAADVIYDQTLFEPLCRLVKRCLRRSTDVGVYFCCTIRSSDTFSSFLGVIANNDLCIDYKHTLYSKELDYNYEKILLLRIGMKQEWML